LLSYIPEFVEYEHHKLHNSLSCAKRFEDDVVVNKIHFSRNVGYVLRKHFSGESVSNIKTVRQYYSVDNTFYLDVIWNLGLEHWKLNTVVLEDVSVHLPTVTIFNVLENALREQLLELQFGYEDVVVDDDVSNVGHNRNEVVFAEVVFLETCFLDRLYKLKYFFLYFFPKYFAKGCRLSVALLLVLLRSKSLKLSKYILYHALRYLVYVLLSAYAFLGLVIKGLRSRELHFNGFVANSALPIGSHNLSCAQTKL
jgi:hypothetical protein